jgi:cysteine rich repeat protein
MKYRMITVGLGILLNTVFAASLGVATNEVCRSEMDKLCKGVAAGEGRILKCLQEHDADLSDACRAYVNTASQYVACLDDVLQLCPGTQPGGARGMKCLRANQGKLSTECKNEIRKHRP